MAASRKVKKALKGLHTGYVVIIVIALLIGAALGAYYATTVTANDKFVLNGEKTTSVSVGKELKYVDEGITCISMGKDVSDKVEIKTNMEVSDDGKTYTGSTLDEGEYYITYTVTEGRYAGLSRVRTFTVSSASENQ